jgi:hypothetical protein
MLTSQPPERHIWTIAYRKRTANRFHRVDLALTWRQAYDLAGRAVQAAPDRQVYYVTNAASEREEAARIAAGDLAESYADDHRNVMVDSGKKIRIVEGGSLDDLNLSPDDIKAVRDAPHREKAVEQAHTNLTNAADHAAALVMALALSPAVLRGLCDLLYLDDIGRKTTLARRVVDEMKGSK